VVAHKDVTADVSSPRPTSIAVMLDETR